MGHHAGRIGAFEVRGRDRDERSQARRLRPHSGSSTPSRGVDRSGASHHLARGASSLVVRAAKKNPGTRPGFRLSGVVTPISTILRVGLALRRRVGLGVGLGLRRRVGLRRHGLLRHHLRLRRRLLVRGRAGTRRTEVRMPASARRGRRGRRGRLARRAWPLMTSPPTSGRAPWPCSRRGRHTPGRTARRSPA